MRAGDRLSGRQVRVRDCPWDWEASSFWRAELRSSSSLHSLFIANNNVTFFVTSAEVVISSTKSTHFYDSNLWLWLHTSRRNILSLHQALMNGKQILRIEVQWHIQIITWRARGPEINPQHRQSREFSLIFSEQEFQWKYHPRSVIGLHSRSGETVGNLVGNQLAAGCDTRLEWGYFQLPTQKAAKPVGY